MRVSKPTGAYPWEQASGVAFAALLAVQMLTGCASTGVPKAPSLMLPQVVRMPLAERQGRYVDLRWSVPTLTTDRQPLTTRKHGAGTLTAELCRVDGADCVVLARQVVTPGEAASARDELGPALTAGPARPVRYRVRILNGAGRGAGWSRDAIAAAGEAPAAMTRLGAATSSQGMQLTWQAAPAATGDRIVLRAAVPDKPERNLTVPADASGAIDPGAAAGDTVRYTVQRARSVEIDGMSLAQNGEHATVTVTMAKDTFPPRPPRGLLAVAVQMEGAPPEIDLSWEPNAEADLLGYIVTRVDTDQPGTVPIRLNAEPTAMVSYRDAAVVAGHGYRYTITAVDRSGNVSGSSQPFEQRLR